MSNTNTNTAKKNNSTKNTMDLLNKLHKQQVDWNNNLYKNATDKLLSLLGDCLAAYELLKDDREARKELNVKLELLGIKCNDSAHLTTRVVRYVFRLTGKRTNSYARVLRAAIDYKIDALGLAAWVREQGGIDAVTRKRKEGLTAVEQFKLDVENTGNALASIAAMHTIDKLNKQLLAGTEAYENYSIAIVRHDENTGHGDIVWGTDNIALTKRALAVVSKDVLAQHKASKTVKTAAAKRAARAAAVNATAAANSNNTADDTAA